MEIHDIMLERYNRPPRHGALHLNEVAEWKAYVAAGDALILDILIKYSEEAINEKQKDGA